MVRSSTTFQTLTFLAFFLLLISFQFHSNVLAFNSETGTRGASFLQIPIGPRLLASTEVVTGIDPDASMAFSNPAALSGIAGGELFLTTANWLDEMQMSAAGIVVPIPQSSLSLAFSTRLLYSGGLKGYDDALQVVSEESYYDLGFSTALCQHFEQIGLSIGLGMTYIREHLYPEDGNGYALSFGTVYRRGKNSFHLFAKDVGGKITFNEYRYPIDGRYVLGYGRLLNLHHGNVNIGAQLTFSQTGSKQLQFGGEYKLNRNLMLRTALRQSFDSPENSQFPVSAGMGFRFFNMAIDYAFMAHSYFPATHMFSFSYAFGQWKAPAETDMDPRINTAPVFPSSPAADKKPDPSDTNKPKEDKREMIPPPTIKPETKPEPKNETIQEPEIKSVKRSPTYILLVSIHGHKESALAEVRVLKLLKIQATMEAVGDRYRVIAGRYKSRKAAESAAESYEGRGYRFEILKE